MHIYETDEMDTVDAIRFMRLFDQQVGTDRELSNAASGVIGMSYVVCFELESNEVNICRKIENNL